MNKNFVLAVLFSGMMFAGSTCVYSMQADPNTVTPPQNTSTGTGQKIEQKDNSAAEKKDVASTLSLENIWNNLKTNRVTTHVLANKTIYGGVAVAVVVAALIYKTFVAQNDDEEEAPTTMRSANYKASR